MLDVYPGPVLTANTTTLTPEGPRSPVRSEHGLYFVPRSDLDSAPELDRLLVPGRTAPSVTDPRVRSWAREEGLKLEFLHAHAPAGFPFDATLSDLAEHENAPVARFTARLLEYPIGHSASPGAAGPSLACSGRSPWGFWASPSPRSSTASSARRRSASRHSSKGKSA